MSAGLNSAPGFWRGEWLSVRVQIALGALFVAAAIPKILQPPVFAKNIHAYALVPSSLINIEALILPGVEIIAGLALIIGIWRRGAALTCAALLVMFMAALTWNLVIGNPVSCSCFDLAAAAKPCAEQLAEMKWTILRDVGMLLLALHVLWADGGGRRRAG